MSRLVVEELSARVEGREILRGIDLEIDSGEVHAVMGRNSSGSSTLSHVLMGRPGYEVTGGSVSSPAGSHRRVRAVVGPPAVADSSHGYT